jgi:flagellar basal body-associated protein FliL
MANQDEPENMRLMWVTVAVIVVLIVGGMGINMLVHHDTETRPTETSNPPE